MIVLLLDMWNEGQLDEDIDEAEPVSASSHSEVAQLEEITGRHSSHIVEGADNILLCSCADVSAVSMTFSCIFVLFYIRVHHLHGLYII